MSQPRPPIQVLPPPVHARHFLARLMGMFSSAARRRGMVVIYPCSSIHTFFMAKPLDVFFLDASRRVLACHASVAPFKALSCRGAYYVLEAGINVLNQKLEIGDVVDF